MNYVSAMKSYVERFRKYNKPIWMTEFCAWEGNNITPEFQRNFLVETFNYLETEPLIERYAWFIGRGWSDGYPYMQLLHRNQEGVLKELGEIFVHLSSYDEDFHHTTGQTIEAEHYIRTADYVHAQKTEDVSGNINLCDYFIGTWADYQVDVNAAGEYDLKFRVAAKYEGALKVIAGDEQIAAVTVSPTDLQVWQTVSCKANLEAGKQTVRIEVTKGRVNFNWWSITQPGLAIETVSPADASVSAVTVFDLSGRKLIEKRNDPSVDLSSLKAGVYIVSVSAASGEKKSSKVIKK
jgi:hypothetical protein